MKITNTNIANYYGFTRQTIGTWKKERPLVYQALERYFIKQYKEDEHTTTTQETQNKDIEDETNNRTNEHNAKNG